MTTPRITVLALGLCLAAACTKTTNEPPPSTPPVPPDAPVVTRFSALPTTVGAGKSAVLSWAVTGATEVVVDQGVGALRGESGSVTVTPSATTVYTLTATRTVDGLSATSTAQATVTVDARPFKLTSFTATPATTSFGGSVTLSWTSEGVPDVLTLNGTMVLASSTSMVVKPVRRQTFTLAGSNGPAGVNQDSKSLVVAARGLDTLVGEPAGVGNVDGIGSAARFNQPTGLAVATDGTVYVADTDNCVIRKIDPLGVVTTLAGRAGVCANTDGTGANAAFGLPMDIALDRAGTLYVSDMNAHAIRKVTPAGVVTTLTSALVGPWGVSFDAAGTLYVADYGNFAVNKVNVTTGEVSLVVNLMGRPLDVAIDAAGLLFITDYTGGNLMELPSFGLVTLETGRSFPAGLAFDGAGTLYLAASGSHRIDGIGADGGSFGYLGSSGHSGSSDGHGSDARFFSPQGLSTDAAGNLFVADTGNNLIRKVTPDGDVTTLAGKAPATGWDDGPRNLARFDTVGGVAFDGAGNLYITDRLNTLIRKMSPAGVVTTLAGNGIGGARDGLGEVAQFQLPTGVVVNDAGVLFVADRSNHAIRKVTPDGEVTTLAGTLTVAGSADGVGTNALFSDPDSLAFDLEGNLIVADSDNNTIRKVTMAGVVTTLAGAPQVIGSDDGPAAQARFSYPTGPVVDAMGNIFVADLENHTIRKLSPAGMVTTVAGTPGMDGAADGMGAAARFSSPYAMTIDRAGNLFVTDFGNNAIRRVTPEGAVSTVAGSATQLGFVPGPLPGSLGTLYGITLSADGDLVVACENGVVQITAP